jgi:hypothetical protein
MTPTTYVSSSIPKIVEIAANALQHVALNGKRFGFDGIESLRGKAIVGVVCEFGNVSSLYLRMPNGEAGNKGFSYLKLSPVAGLLLEKEFFEGKALPRMH